jgi:hypothetical protein
MTTDSLATRQSPQSLDELSQAFTTLEGRYAAYQAAVEAELKVRDLIEQELMEAIRFLLRSTNPAKLQSSFLLQSTGTRWRDQTQALIEAIDSLRENVPQCSTPPTQEQP